jgi:benzoyl-CoA reductase/2-hydroxyglutaryl-CoA dehydratase subunit BcrC/BadD/HgdB
MEVYLASPWIPREWVEVHGLVPRGLFCAPVLGTLTPRMAEGICSFAQQSLELARTYCDRGNAVVFVSSCDQMRRGFDLVGEQETSNAFLFNLPATWQSDAAWRLFRLEFERFTRFLERIGGHRQADESVAIIIDTALGARERLRSSWNKLRARGFAECIARLHWDGCTIVESVSDVNGDAGVPVAVVGGPLTPAQWGILDAIESAGGRVVLNATETGERSLGLEMPRPGRIAGSIDSLARFFFSRIIDVWQRPNTRLYDWVRERIEERNVRGIVLWHHVGCDLWRAEAASLREAFGLPILTLDSEQAYSDHPRLMHRIAAFMEILR